MNPRLTNQSPSDDAQRALRLVRGLDAEKQRRTKAERQARILRVASAKFHRYAEAWKVRHP